MAETGDLRWGERLLLAVGLQIACALIVVAEARSAVGRGRGRRSIR